MQRDLHHEKFRNSVLFCPLAVTAKIDEWQKLTYEPGGTVDDLCLLSVQLEL